MASVFDKSIVNQIQQANDIVDLVSEHVSLAKKGREMVGVCPFHEDHRPSMFVSGEKQIFKCFACGAGGDVFKFVQMRENLTFPQAIERLAQRAGIKIPSSAISKGTSNSQSSDVDPNRLAKANAWAVQYFQKNLHDGQKGQQARDYLADRRITPESIKKWQLGLTIYQNDLVKAAKACGIPEKLLEQAGLVLGQGSSLQDKFVNRLMFPITDVTSRVIGFGGRTLDGSGAKYINSPTTILFDKSNCLYGLEQARHAIVSTGAAIVVEGYTDCIMAHQFGCSNVVATLGTSFTVGHGRILRRYAKKAILLFDSDIAGIEAANRALEVCLSQHIDIKLASVPEGKDPCDFLLVAGKERFEQLIDEAVDVFQFKWDRLKESFGSDETLAGKKNAFEEFLQTIATSLRSGNLTAVDRGLIVNRLSSIIGLDSKEINAELSKKIVKAAKAANYTNTISTKNQTVKMVDWGQGLFATAQREILEVLLNQPDLFETVKGKITVDLFDVPVLKQIAEILFESLDFDTNASVASILAKTESIEVSQYLVELVETGEEKGNFQSRLTGALDVIGRYRAGKKSCEIKTKEDQAQFLRRVSENIGKQNPHNIGMT